MDKCFVACQCKETKDLFCGKSRLYAFPAKPDLVIKNEFVILDSGAYSLSLKGLEIDAEYMFRLSRFYKKYNASNQFPVLGIAPDKFLDPFKTMDNYKFWMEHIKLPVVPVIQFTQKGKIDMYSAFKQIDFYKGHSKIIAISNPSLLAYDAKGMDKIVTYSHKYFDWVHNLGAGWNAMDCKLWFDYGFDSIDSISYYTDAKKSMQWIPLSASTRLSKLSFEEICLSNYKLANNSLL